MTAQVSNESASPVDVERVSALAEFVMARMYVHPESEVSVVFVDPEPMEKLHIQWMDLPGPTDVMSFPMDELTPGSADACSGPGLLGDIVVCGKVAARQAADAGHSEQHEVDVLIAHGMLHLLGFDHAEPDEEREMFALQAELVAAFGVSVGAS